MDFDPSEEIEVDRRIHKQLNYGNNMTSAGLGLSHMNAGIMGKEVEVQAHIVEGATPFLSAKFLYDMDDDQLQDRCGCLQAPQPGPV